MTRLHPVPAPREVSRQLAELTADGQRMGGVALVPLRLRQSCCLHENGPTDDYPSIKHGVDSSDAECDGTMEEGITVRAESLVGVDGGKEGVTLEDQVSIAEDGIERLSTYPIEDEWL